MTIAQQLEQKGHRKGYPAGYPVRWTTWYWKRQTRSSPYHAAERHWPQHCHENDRSDRRRPSANPPLSLLTCNPSSCPAGSWQRYRFVFRTRRLFRTGFGTDDALDKPGTRQQLSTFSGSAFQHNHSISTVLLNISGECCKTFSAIFYSWIIITLRSVVSININSFITKINRMRQEACKPHTVYR